MTDYELKVFLVQYEIRSAWWLDYFMFNTLQSFWAKYFAQKVERKFKKFKESEKSRQALVKAGYLKEREIF